MPKLTLRVTVNLRNCVLAAVGGAPSEITKIRPFFLEKFELEFLPEEPAEKSTPPGEGKGRRSSICSCL